MPKKNKGYIKWLVTWEGHDFDPNSRCMVVTALPPEYRERGITTMLPFLYSATYGNTLCDKIHFGNVRGSSMFQKPYRDKFVEFWFGQIPKEYISVRLVKHLRCEESKTAWYDSTLYWTENPKYRINPKLNPDDITPENYNDSLIEVKGEYERSYSYSIRDKLEAEKIWRKNMHKS